VSPVKYELGFYAQKTAFFKAISVIISDLTKELTATRIRPVCYFV
jgi:hypothetical protein